MRHLIEAVRQHLAAIDAEVAQHADLPELVAALNELRTARAEMAIVHDGLEAQVVEAMCGRWETVIDGFGGVKVHGGKERKRWRHDDLWPLALDQARSGEMAAPGETSPEALLRVIRSAVQPAYWRARVLKGWGIDPDEYAEVSWGRKTIEIVR